MATKVRAQIVLSQSGWTPPAGYTFGSAEGFALATAISATVLNSAGITGYAWTLVPRIGLTPASYAPTGLNGQTATFTPPAVTGWGDLALQLTVYGDPLPDGTPNVDTTTVIVGIRFATGIYAPGLPIPHWYESSLGGSVTIDASRGRERRVHELALALQALIAAGGATTSINVTAQPVLTGAVVFAAGAGITLTQTGQTIAVTSAAGTSGVVKIPFTNANFPSTLDTTLVLPAGAWVECWVDVGTAFPTGTVALGTTALPNAIAAAGDVNLAVVGTQRIAFAKLIGAFTLRATLTGAPATGVGTFYAQYFVPQT